MRWSHVVACGGEAASAGSVVCWASVACRCPPGPPTPHMLRHAHPTPHAYRHQHLASHTSSLPPVPLSVHAQETGLPVRWTFLWSGAEFHTLEWHEGEALPKDMWQAPAYCFHPPAPTPAGDAPGPLDNPLASGRIMRLSAAAAAGGGGGATPAASEAHTRQQQVELEAKLASS